MRRFVNAHRLLAGLGAALVLFATTPAQAYPDFPGVLQEELQLDCLPSCLLCHTRMEGGKGYLKAGDTELPGKRGYGVFISNVMAAGLGVPKEDNLPSYLFAFRKFPCGGPMSTLNAQGTAGDCDSDGDGSPDLKELHDGTDPDTKDVKGKYSCLIPEYGCGGASIAPLPRHHSGTGRAVALVAALGVGLTLARRFRR